MLFYSFIDKQSIDNQIGSPYDNSRKGRQTNELTKNVCPVRKLVVVQS